MVEGVEATPMKPQGMEDSKGGKSTELPDFFVMIQKEIAKYLSGHNNLSSGDIHSFSSFADYSGKMHQSHFAMSLLSALDKDKWIVDTGASRHICSFPELVNKTTMLDHPVTVHLPDGTSVAVAQSGSIKLSNEFVLTDVLIVPSFKYNLLSVSQLLEGNKLECVFSQGKCWLQDPDTGRIRGVGKAMAGLYIFAGGEFSGACSNDDAIDVLKAEDENEFETPKGVIEAPPVIPQDGEELGRGLRSKDSFNFLPSSSAFSCIRFTYAILGGGQPRDSS
ncbi:hypothetical protein DH2020_047376 [Rehmannia glutinosa]|uniref:Retrovirus-related Pol polyprotein from transposon TNT 1-94-like beta-barrel domain-containing protein n=1 Tax=Rehmannia glutinosa TaxID=99300 RepID=A0ABR0U8K8_REHGL